MTFPEAVVRTELRERVEAVGLTMHCGRFVAVNHIPDDWSVRIDGPVSEETSLYMQAGHGTSMLSRLGELNEFVTVTVCDPTCFSIAGSVALDHFDGDEDNERQVDIGEAELIFNPPISEHRR